MCAHELGIAQCSKRVQSIKKGRAFSVEAAVTYPKTLLSLLLLAAPVH